MGLQCFWMTRIVAVASASSRGDSKEALHRMDQTQEAAPASPHRPKSKHA